MADPKHGDAWWTLVACMALMLIAGTIYAFSEFSDLFKDKEGYKLDQTEVSVLALFASLGNYFVIDGGILISKVGTVSTLICGACFASLGYFALWIAVVFFPGRWPFEALIFFCFLYGHGCGYIDSAVMTQLLHDFPGYKGNIVGSVKAFYGLATAVFAIAYDAIFAPVQSYFLFFVGAYSLLSGLIWIPVVYRKRGLVEDSRSNVLMKFRYLTVGLVLAVLFSLVVSLASPAIDKLRDLEKAFIWKPIVVAMFVGIGSLCLLPRQCESRCMEPQDDGNVVPQTVGRTSYSAEGAVLHQRGSSSDNRPSPEDSGPQEIVTVPMVAPVDMTAVKMLQQVDFWLLLTILIISQGSGLEIVHEARQIMPAITESEEETSVTGFVAMISCFNSFGRLCFGHGSEMLLTRIPRTAFLVVSSSLLALSHVLLAFLPSTFVLWTAGAIAGFAYGGLWGVQPVIVMELFGTTDYGFKYTCTAMAAGIGFLIFGTLLAARLYDQTAEELGSAPKCLQPKCFQTAFIVTFICCLPAVLGGVLLWRRTRPVYEELRRARLPQERMELAREE